MKKDKIIIGILSVFVVLLLGITGFRHKSGEPRSVYQVYLNGEKIGLVDNKDKLLNLINEEQQDIKDTYGVNQVYPPNGFDIEEYVTYDENVTSASQIYQKIKEQSDFTIEGYIITITTPATENTEEKVVSFAVLDDDVYKQAEYNFVTTFVDEKDYNAYMTNTQEPIRDVGQTIKHMEFQETVTIKEAYVSVKDKIFTDVNELTQYLLYGSTEPKQTYTIQKGDTLSSIAEASKLNVRELLIANPKYRNSNAVLAIGDTVSNGIISPLLNLHQEMRVVEDVEQGFTKKTVVDTSMPSGTSKVTQVGVTGLERMTEELLVINGERTQGVTVINSTTIRPMVEEVTSVGPSYTYHTNFPSGATGNMYNTNLNWTWPTNRAGVVITTDYEWRWGSFHNALDISGTGFGSPIYAARGGTVVEAVSTCADNGWYGSSCGLGYGNYLVIQHENNYYTMYAHLKSNLNVRVGSKVNQGDVIAYMGNSGSSTGTHLHFGFAVGMPNHGGKWYNPRSLF